MYLSTTCPTCQEFERDTLRGLQAAKPGAGFRVMRTYTDAAPREASDDGTPGRHLDFMLRTGRVSRVPTTLLYSGPDALYPEDSTVGLLTVEQLLTMLEPQAAT